MLTSLHIENVAVIKTLNLDFSKGFTVLTGETGAGKSIILGSVRMLLGARTDRDSIRTGEEKATVEGLFSEIDDRSRALLNESGIAPDENGELLLLRTLTAEEHLQNQRQSRALIHPEGGGSDPDRNSRTARHTASFERGYPSGAP